jgi:ubiquinone/menaquinone biosynthesis C-methylase UbiE
MFAPSIDAENDCYDASHYGQLMAIENRHFWHRGRSRIIVWAVEKYRPNPTTFLDIGTGTGYVLQQLRLRFPNTRFHAADGHTESLRRVAERVGGNVELLQLDARNLPFRDEFDCVGLFDVIEHVDEDRQLLHEAWSVLRPGGSVFITVPQHAFLWSAADEVARHKRRYGRRELCEKVTSEGFRILFVSSFVTLLLPALFVSRLRSKTTQNFKPEFEFNIPGALNALGQLALGIELTLIRAGLSLPIGGSLLCVARRPA